VPLGLIQLMAAPPRFSHRVWMTLPIPSISRAGRLSAGSRLAVRDSERAIGRSLRLLRLRCYPDDGTAPRLSPDRS
jgi:hypothetical protein